MPLGSAVEQLGDQCGDRAALGPGERDVGEQRVTLERLDHRDDAVVATDPEVVALGDVVGEHHPAALAQPAERREQHRALEVLRLVDDHEAVGEVAAPDVRERQHLEQAAAEHLVDHRGPGDGLERVGDGRAPRRHLLGLGARQVAEVLPPDGEDRPEHDDPVVRALLEHGVEPGRQGQDALAGAGRSAEAHDPDGGVGQQVDGDALLGRPAADVEQRAVAPHEVDPLVVVHAPEGRLLRSRVEHHAGVAGQVPGLGQVDDVLGEQRVDDAPLDVELDDTLPAGIDRQLVAVLVGVEPHDRSLEPQRQVLGDHRDLTALGGQVAGDGEDPVVVGVAGQRRREAGHLRVVDLDPERAALVVGRHRPEQRAVPDPEVLEQPQRPARRPAQLGVVALGLELGEHHERQHHLVLVEACQAQGSASSTDVSTT